MRHLLSLRKLLKSRSKGTLDRVEADRIEGNRIPAADADTVSSMGLILFEVRTDDDGQLLQTILLDRFRVNNRMAFAKLASMPGSLTWLLKKAQPCSVHCLSVLQVGADNVRIYLTKQDVEAFDENGSNVFLFPYTINYYCFLPSFLVDPVIGNVLERR